LLDLYSFFYLSSFSLAPISLWLTMLLLIETLIFFLHSRHWRWSSVIYAYILILWAPRGVHINNSCIWYNLSVLSSSLSVNFYGLCDGWYIRYRFRCMSSSHVSVGLDLSKIYFLCSLAVAIPLVLKYFLDWLFIL
jgi:hypothetical protein